MEWRRIRNRRKKTGHTRDVELKLCRSLLGSASVAEPPPRLEHRCRVCPGILSVVEPISAAQIYFRTDAPATNGDLSC
jgi:hypothetical protein